jgi:DNA-binding response OmpR family regulator
VSALKLVVAEDDPAMQGWLRSVLERMGASVSVASSGWELLTLLADNHEVLDLVISDVRMPMPNGVDALAMARAAGVSVPFVLISAFATDYVREAARSLSASVLDKPFLQHELEARVRDSLVRRGDH